MKCVKLLPLWGLVHLWKFVGLLILEILWCRCWASGGGWWCQEELDDKESNGRDGVVCRACTIGTWHPLHYTRVNREKNFTVQEQEHILASEPKKSLLESYEMWKDSCRYVSKNGDTICSSTFIGFFLLLYLNSLNLHSSSISQSALCSRQK